MNNNEIIDGIENENPDKNIDVTNVGRGVVPKFKTALKANKEFIESLFFIGREIALCLPKQAKKIGYAWAELSKEGLLLVKKMGNTIKIDCIPFDVLGMFAIHEYLPRFNISLPNLPKLPDINIIKNLLAFSRVDILTPMKNIFKGFGFNERCLKNFHRWNEPDYVYNGCPE